MSDFKIQQIGVASAKPNLRHLPSCTVVDYRGNIFMVDCGEGAQRELMRQRVKMSRMNHIFLTHLHGDHVLGLPGLIGTLELQGKGGKITIHTFEDGKRILTEMFNYFMRGDEMNIEFNVLDPKKSEVAFENDSLRVTTVPLEHRVPCVGYVFEEKGKQRHINREMIDFYKVPVSQIRNIKAGADFVTPEGKVIPCDRLTTPADPSRKYVHIGDTLYLPRLVETAKGADLLFHETTYLEENRVEARERGHSTARQAAMIARDAGVKKLLTGHYSSRYRDYNLFLKEAQEVFPDTILGDEGVTVEL